METPPLQERAAALIRQGQAAAQAGQQELARRYLQAAVDIAPDNATAWLWLAGVQEPAEARESLKKVLELDPGNSRATAGLAWAERQLARPEPPPPASGAAGITGRLSSAATSQPLANRDTRSHSVEQELRAHLREAQPEPSVSETSDEETPPKVLNRPRMERPVVRLPAEAEPPLDAAARRYRLLFLLLLVLLVIGLLVLSAALFGLI